MKILVVDRDSLSNQNIRTRLEPVGHKVIEEAVKNDAVDLMAADDFDLVLLDPSPLTAPRPLILNVRRAVRNYPYILMMSDSLDHEEALKAGANDLLAKPVDKEALDVKVENAQRLISLVRHIGDDSEDFPSGSGVIAKSAMNQLFLAAMDRADRYGERTYFLQIELSNYTEILSTSGTYAADFAIAKLCQYLVRLRRQSDIIGQTARNEYSLLLQRPMYESEPVDAANRFAEAFTKYTEGDEDPRAIKAEIKVSLLDIPSGALLVQHVISPGESVRSTGS